MTTKLLELSSPHSQRQRLRGSLHTELEFFRELPQDGGTDGDPDDLMLERQKHALPGGKGEAGAQSSLWIDNAEGSLNNSSVEQEHLQQQQESNMEIQEQSSLLTEGSFRF